MEKDKLQLKLIIKDMSMLLNHFMNKENKMNEVYQNISEMKKEIENQKKEEALNLNSEKNSLMKVIEELN